MPKADPTLHPSKLARKPLITSHKTHFSSLRAKAKAKIDSERKAAKLANNTGALPGRPAAMC